MSELLTLFHQISGVMQPKILTFLYSPHIILDAGKEKNAAGSRSEMEDSEPMSY